MGIKGTLVAVIDRYSNRFYMRRLSKSLLCPHSLVRHVTTPQGLRERGSQLGFWVLEGERERDEAVGGDGGVEQDAEVGGGGGG
jgi:hypothetical protein